MSLATLYVTCADTPEAEKIGAALIEKRLVACCNILGQCISLFRWEGEVKAEGEVVMICKTQMRLVRKATEAIKELHSYDVPCVTAMPILKASKEYNDWVIEETTAPE
jgi:periplasmic divalent cation tolerance protein